MGSLAEELRSCAFQVHGKGRGRMDHLEVRSGEEPDRWTVGVAEGWCGYRNLSRSSKAVP